MKNRLKILGLIMLVCMLFVVACQRPESETAATDDTGEDVSSPYEVDEGEELGDTQGQENTVQESEDSSHDSANDDSAREEGPVNITIYQSNEEGDGLIYTEEVIESLTADNVLRSLISRGDLPTGVSVLSFNESGGEGSRLLELNLSREFDEFIGAQGSWGEFVAIGSIVNTFLSAFDADNIVITVGGEVLVTPHMGELTEPLGRFDIF